MEFPAVLRVFLNFPFSKSHFAGLALGFHILQTHKRPSLALSQPCARPASSNLPPTFRFLHVETGRREIYYFFYFYGCGLYEIAPPDDLSCNGVCHQNQESPQQTKPKKGPKQKFMIFAHFCEFWCFSLGKQARFTSNFCSGLPPRKVHELAFLWFGLPG